MSMIMFEELKLALEKLKMRVYAEIMMYYLKKEDMENTKYFRLKTEESISRVSSLQKKLGINRYPEYI